MKIVEMEEKHVNDLAHALISAYAYEPWNELWTMEQARSCIMYVLHDANGIGYTALDADTAVGAVFGRIQLYREYEFYINHIYVHRDFQRRGYAKKLMHTLENELRRRHIMQVELQTVPYDRKFYERCGYKVSTAIPMEHILTETELK